MSWHNDTASTFRVRENHRGKTRSVTALQMLCQTDGRRGQRPFLQNTLRHACPSRPLIALRARAKIVLHFAAGSQL